MNEPAILLVEDNEDDVFLFRRAVKAAAITNPIFVVQDGQEALDYLAGVGQFGDRSKFPTPAAIFLDLKLPIKTGFAVLRWLRDQPCFRITPVVILSSSSEPTDIQEAERLGANSHRVKPPSSAMLLDVAKKLKWDWLRFQS